MKTLAKRIIVAFCFLITLTPLVKGQGTIKGLVTDKFTGENLHFVNIILFKEGKSIQYRGTTTDFDGVFVFSTVPVGKYDVQASFVGYRPIRISGVSVDSSNFTIVDVKMESNAIEISEIEIVSHRIPLIEKGTPESGQRISAAEEPLTKSKKTKPEKKAKPEKKTNESYEPNSENRFFNVAKEPLSTFSLDVDNASYSNVRRMINQGRMPYKDAVRIEEMLNYFDYEYEQPKGEHPVNIATETAVCPWNSKHKLVKIGVKAKEIYSEKLPPANFVFLIDVSGSMAGATRIDLVKSSMKLLVNNLREEDRVAIVTYANNVHEVLQSTSGNEKEKIMDAIEELVADGWTAGGDGIQRAYRIAEENFSKDGNNRIILCTDGDFNVGISNTKDLGNFIEQKRKTGIFLTVLGYGMGNYKDDMLQTLAQKGNGNHAYIDNIQEAKKVLVNEFSSTMYTVAKDVKLQIEFNPAHVNAYRLIGYESRLLDKEDFNDDTKDAAELGAGHSVTALYEIIPVGVENAYDNVDKLKYQEVSSVKKTKNKYPNEMMTVKLRYKNPKSIRSQKMEIAIPAKNKNTEVSKDFKFAMAVAMFGQLLKDSEFKGNSTYKKVMSLAEEGVGEDKFGYRKEFVRLVESVEQLAR